MNPHSFRSVCSRAGWEAQRANNIHIAQRQLRDLSTSPWSLNGNSTAPPASNLVRQRSRAAASEMSSLAKRNGPMDAAKKSALDAQSTSQPRVLDVRSLPRGLKARGRGGPFRGRDQSHLGAATHGENPRTQSPTSESRNRFSRPAGRGSALGARGRKGGRAGALKARPRVNRDNGGDDKDVTNKNGPRRDPSEVMDPFEEQFDRDMRFGTTTMYRPEVTLEALADFSPAVPSTAPNSRRATILANLSALGAADPVGAPQVLQAASYAADLERGGVRFFADAKSRGAAEQYLRQKQAETTAEQDGGEDTQGVVVQDAEESVRKVILEQAVQGKHEKTAFATGPVGISRAWHLRAETWTMKDVCNFEKKLTSLVGGAKKTVAEA